MFHLVELIEQKQILTSLFVSGNIVHYGIDTHLHKINSIYATLNKQILFLTESSLLSMNREDDLTTIVSCCLLFNPVVMLCFLESIYDTAGK